MSPRAYKLGEREASAQETRKRIIHAARQVVATPEGISAFTVEAVARQAGVSRMTVYYQFGSKAGLLEKLYDDLGERGLVPRLQAVFVQKDAIAALSYLIDAFSRFWAAEYIVTRRLRALARLDPVVGEGIDRRDSWRRQLMHNALTRAASESSPVAAALEAGLEDGVYALTSFEYFDVLAALQGAEQAVVTVKRLVLQILGLDEAMP